MRGGQLARRWRVIRLIEASKGLTVAEIANPKWAQGTGYKKSPTKASSNNSWNELFCYGGADTNFFKLHLNSVLVIIPTLVVLSRGGRRRRSKPGGNFVSGPYRNWGIRLLPWPYASE